MDKQLVTIILPAFNEEAIIEISLIKIAEYLEELKEQFEFEILLIDDGSTDKTFEIANQCKTNIPVLKVIRHPVNLNLGTSLKTGFANAKGTYIITYDLDLSYSLDHIGSMLKTIHATKADIVVASPYMKGGKVTQVPFTRRMFSKVANYYMYLIAQRKFSTFTGMVRAYKASFIQSMNLKAMDFEINPEIIYKALILRGHILEIPGHLDWTFQNSFGKKRTSGLRMLRSCFSGLMAGFMFRPYFFFITSGSLLFLIFLYLITWIAIKIYRVYPTLQGNHEFFDDRFSLAVRTVFNDTPYSFLIGGFVLVIAIQLLSLGFISLQSKRYFEENFHINTSILQKIIHRK